MLKLNKKNVQYSQIYNMIPVTAKGASIKDMRHCATTLGMDVRVVKASPETLKECPLPAIAHCEEEKATTGHYVVLISVGPQNVELVDGTTGRLLLVPKVKFYKDWTGYLLISESPGHWRSWGIAALAGATVGLIAFSRVRLR